MHDDNANKIFTKHFFIKKTFYTTCIFFILLCGLLTTVEGKKKVPTCAVCKDIVSDFEKGMQKTSKSNYGGGNTNWEEEKLGSYARSEVRLVEIIEDLCKSGDKDCHTMLEEYEELIERFWFKEMAINKDANFQKWFCIDNVKACCPSNKYGPSCKSCSGMIGDKPCGGNGVCDGEGTREGNGECKCNPGYQGEVCRECKDGYYEDSKNDTYISCKACHLSCKSTCWEGGPKGCDECDNGWTHSEEHGCQDIDECSTSPSICSENQYCSNTEGSYTCFTCNIACVGCSGSGPDKCNQCSEGFTLEGNTCQDIDECSAGSLCTGDNEQCVNDPGTYHCDCKEGFHKREDKCVPKPKEQHKPKHPNAKDKKRKGGSKKKQKDSPSLLVMNVVLVVFGIVCKISKGNLLLVAPLTAALSIYIYWFASSFDKS